MLVEAWLSATEIKERRTKCCGNIKGVVYTLLGWECPGERHGEETFEPNLEEVNICQANGLGGGGNPGRTEPPEWGWALTAEPTRAWHTVGHLQCQGSGCHVGGL